MDKSCHSSSAPTGESVNPTTSSSTDQYLKHLNKLSHKIAKPIIKKPNFDNHNQPSLQNQNQNQNQSQSLNLQQQHQHQPPVYNINKSDFRDVVQKLTGSPAHERSFSTPPPIQPPKPTSSRLQRIRPPPLPQLTIRSPPAAQPPPPTNPSTAAQPFSPLPPFPAVHAAAESPISAYMRYLHSSSSNADSDSKRFSGFSPLQSTAPLHFPMPSSPVPFGCLPSPKSPYPSLFSPTQFPLSPTVPSPRWKGV